ncbi:hypothetical protein ACOYW6_05805 [Parablastomonas sp. CN1-191]|uniref:hypothetical protein n=1 Tax=Parablastomonas sp. CN1-191 TaxID=3400908 RepID=UPI003BF89CB3
MTRISIVRAARLALGVATLAAAVPAAAEKLVFDHRLSPALEAAFAGDEATHVAYDARNPAYVTDLIAVRGTTKDWTEALVIIARKPAAPVSSADAWVDELKAEALRKCSATFTEIARDAGSVTFERRSTGCAAGYPPVAIYRAIGSGKSLFLLAAMARDGLSEESLRQWRAVLASARIE